ncbi:hypothetical protein [Sphingopyxis sp. MG]|uniref:hypothetical protein n=2 Tax=Sphingopyxis TaxID=165697 RepID=UPI000957E99E|nr:hypothetical protein [Sphingopyxis sp. MG]APW73004.1 hypothetical protein BWD40_09345 [Sphingopyxis granuli]
MRSTKAGAAMDGDDNSNEGTRRLVAAGPFALIVAQGFGRRSPAEIERALRHMGLRPEGVAADGQGGLLATGPDAPTFHLRLGATELVAGPAGAAALDFADPDAPATSQLAAGLPPDWREAGRCWAFVAPGGATPSAGGGQATRMRELFKTLVLLIDLFDASHIFWSPARLWSDAPQFRAAVAEMLTSGMPPVLHLVAFRRHETAGGAHVGTRGLAAFAGQELTAAIPAGWTVADMVRRLARLALDIMVNGPIVERQRARGLQQGEWVDLSPRLDADRGHAVVDVAFDRGG